MSNYPFLNDRIKQFSEDLGTGNLTLGDEAIGFSSFADVYADGDTFFYAITDGTRYEIGSGVFVTGVTNSIQRHAIINSDQNSNNINFPAGKKEIFVTHPATHAIMMGSGLANHNVPARRGIAFWESSHTLNYDSEFYWNDTLKHLGIRTNVPEYGIDVQGDGSAQSMVRASGFVVGPTGIHFPQDNGDDSSYEGGIQYQHFEPNELYDQNLNNIIELSGNVHNIFKLKKQNAGYVFAGPIAPADCLSNCGEALPSFRVLEEQDLPNTVVFSGGLIATSGYLSAYTDAEIAALSGYLETQSVGTLSGHLQSQIDDNDACCDTLTNTSNELVEAKTFSIVNNSNGAYSISGVGTLGTDNPDIVLHKGLTYDLNIDAVGHNFWIKTESSTGTDNAYNSGVTNNGIESGILKFTVPNDSPSRLYYNCQYHASMSGSIFTIPTESLTKHSTSVIDGGYIGDTYYTDTHVYYYTTNGWKRTALSSNIVPPPPEPSETSIDNSIQPQSSFVNALGASVEPVYKIIENDGNTLTRVSLSISASETSLSPGTSVALQAAYADASGNFTDAEIYNVATLTVDSSGSVNSTLSLPYTTAVTRVSDSAVKTPTSSDLVKYRIVSQADAGDGLGGVSFTSSITNNASLGIDLFIGGNYNTRTYWTDYDETWKVAGLSSVLRFGYANVPVIDTENSYNWGVNNGTEDIGDSYTEKERFNAYAYLPDFYPDYPWGEADANSPNILSGDRDDFRSYQPAILIQEDLWMQETRDIDRADIQYLWNNSIFFYNNPYNINDKDNKNANIYLKDTPYNGKTLNSLLSSERYYLHKKYANYAPLARLTNSSSMGDITHMAVSPYNPHVMDTPTDTCSTYYAVTTKGNVFVWGNNHNLQGGLDGLRYKRQGLTTNSYNAGNTIFPTQVGKFSGPVAISSPDYENAGNQKFIQVEAGDGWAIFLTDNGKVYQAGKSYYDPTHVGKRTYTEAYVEDTNSLVQVNLANGFENIKKISLYDNTCYAIDDDGSIYMWGAAFRAKRIPFEDGILFPDYDQERPMIIGDVDIEHPWVDGSDAIRYVDSDGIEFDDVSVGYDHVMLRSGSKLYILGSHDAKGVSQYVPEYTPIQRIPNFIPVTTSLNTNPFSMAAGHKASAYCDGGYVYMIGRGNGGTNQSTVSIDNKGEIVIPEEFRSRIQAGEKILGQGNRCFISKTYNGEFTIGFINNRSFYVYGFNNGWADYLPDSVEARSINSRSNTGIFSPLSIWDHYADGAIYLGDFEYASLSFSPPYETSMMAMNRQNIMLQSRKAMYREVGSTTVVSVDKRDTIPCNRYAKQGNTEIDVNGYVLDGGNNWGLFACAAAKNNLYSFRMNWSAETGTPNGHRGGINKE